MKYVDIDTITEIAALVIKKREGIISAEEDVRLNDWLERSENNRQLYNNFLNNGDNVSAELITMEKENIEGRVNSIIDKTHTKAPAKQLFTKFAIAASILLMVGLFYVTYHTLSNKNAKHTQLTSLSPSNTKGVILVLEDGTKLFIDSAKNDGLLATQGNTQIIKKGGQIYYIDKKSGQPVNANNTITTPYGKEFQFVLPDGSKVWLNAGSSITFPVAFESTERNITLNGEAYFEVAKVFGTVGLNKNIRQPFIVHNAKNGTANSWTVEVLGTHFNIKAYAEDNHMQTTLMEGSVKVGSGQMGGSVVIKPGYQAGISSSGMVTVNKVDTDEITAWINNRFIFQNTDLKTIMSSVCRWYNMSIIYKADIKDTYTVDVSRNIPLKDLLDFIQKSGGVHFSVAGNAIIVNN